MSYPVNQMEFEEKFSTEEKCLHYLINLKWPDGFVCPSCAHNEYWTTKRMQLLCKKCRHQTTPTAGTIFHKSKKPLGVYFRAIWWIIAQKTGVSATGLQSILGLGSYQTAWEWLHKLRRCMVLPGRERLSGTVEIDETFIGGARPGKRGRGAGGKSLVVIAVELQGYGVGRVRMSIIPNATHKNLKQFILDNIETGSDLVTDGWKSYIKMKTLGYGHKAINDTIAMDPMNLTPNVHRVASLLKRWLLGTHQNFVQKSHLQYYLDEFTFRHNRRNAKSRGLLFEILVKQALLHNPVLRATLKGK
jgi:transposase-like protein